MRDIPFSTFQAVSRLSRGREVVLFGAGNISVKTLRRLNRAPECIIDNSANLWGTSQEGLQVLRPARLTERDSLPFVIICTTSFREVATQLENLGLNPEHDFVVSPILNDLRIIDEMERIEARLLFSSGAQPVDDSERGGGLYELVIRGTEWRHRKVFSGSCHSIVQVEDALYTVDDELGLVELTDDFAVRRNRPLPEGSRGHGLAHHAASGRFFVACSYLDAVLIFDATFEAVGEIPLSLKTAKEGGPFHHTNDCCIVDDSLYVSMFSETGNWKRDVFDGAVVEFDVISGERIGTPIRDLWMPHNVTYLDGSLTVLDSLRGHLLRDNAQVVGDFPAFARGLAYDGEHFYIGQSRNRNFSKNLGISKNISIDTGVVIFDEISKVSRFLQLPSHLSEIHGIAQLPDETS